MEVPEGYILVKESDYKSILARLDKLELENAELRNRLNLNSNNSHKPPSSDGYSKKPIVHNNRVKGHKKPGGQPGHEGRTLLMAECPGKVVEIDVHGECPCGRALVKGRLVGYNRRQVLDLVPQLVETIEYRGLIRECKCGRIHKGSLGTPGVIRYGNGIKTLAVYLSQQQLIPYDRLQQIINDLLGIKISDCFLAGANEQCFDRLEEFEEANKAALMGEKVLCCDETGIRAEGSLKWVHTLSSKGRTHYQIHPKRGKGAIDHIGVLPLFKGTCVHDRFSPYQEYDCTHAFCNAHLLRDLTGLVEEDKKAWAKQMKRLLLKCKSARDNGLLNKAKLKSLNNLYDNIIIRYKSTEVFLQPTWSRGPRHGKKRGRPKRTKSLCLLEVFEQKKSQILRFLYDPNVPFDNNLAERDLRMVKLKQKISGCFRTQKGSEIFCRIRSYISTSRKQNHNVMQALKSAIEDHAILFS